MSKIQPKIAIGDQLLNSLLALPNSAMKKAKETIQKFKTNPDASGLNYESIRGCKDNRLHSIRIDRDYRGIILKQRDKNVYILLWIDKHDDAYAWAARHKFGVNKHTGSIQVIDTESVNEPIESVTPSKPDVIEDKRPDIFMPYTDKDLFQIGATDELIPLIRSIKETDDVEKLERRLPQQLFDALYMLVLGEPYDSVLEELGLNEDKEFDTEDFEAALELENNQQHFLAITDDDELQAILNEPLAKWRVFLHPSQRKLVKGHFNGPVRVLGGAGTGKTVVAMHRAKRLAAACGQNEKVFFTTFTKSLVTDIKGNLQKICSFEEIKNIDVENLDKWAMRFLRDNGYDRKVCFEGSSTLKKLWSQAMDRFDSTAFSSDFLREEWLRVIQYNDISDKSVYLRTPRTGRKGRLSRPQRKEIWPVFEEYRLLLKEHQIWEQADMYRAARLLLEESKASLPYKHLIVDEIQDFHPQAFRLLRAMVTSEDHPNDLFLVGDGHQNIYGHQVVLSKLGINIRGRGKKLKLNYRTPEEARRWASSVLTGTNVSDLDGGNDDLKGYRSVLSGPVPQIRECQSRADEVEEISKWIRSIKDSNPNKIACVCVKTNSLRETYAAELEKQGWQVRQIDDKHSDVSEDLESIRLITMHRIKGLEFDDVCLASCDQSTWRVHDQESQCLIYVAATRTKNSLLITSPGPMSEQFKQQAEA